ncbi:MAG: SigB/SigF/SigG family RNA polymerase sigma factor [Bacilli bacterium]|nr:SigB/SigF/SigG family RNA polymerase sigma factor [Bacilli bacterium]
MAKHKVEITGINTSEIEVLSQEEMEELFKKKDKESRERLINGNLKLVLSILKRFNKKDENMDDLFQVGCIGLVKAIDNFDLSYGVKFSTYCVPMVLGEVRRYLRDNNSIRISRSIKDIAYKVIKLKDELTVKNGREPTDKELADILGIEERDIIVAMDALKPPVSLFEPIYNDGGDTIYLFDQVADQKENKDLNLRLAVDKAVKSLSEREQFILDQRFVIGKTQNEIAEEIGISQAQISRLEKSALQRVRKQL